MELSSYLVVENNTELHFTYSLENLKKSQYSHWMETDESFKKKQVFYKKGNNQHTTWLSNKQYLHTHSYCRPWLMI